MAILVVWSVTGLEAAGLGSAHLNVGSATSLGDSTCATCLLARQHDHHDRGWVLASLTQRGFEVLSNLGRPRERCLLPVSSRMKPDERSWFDPAMRVFLAASAAVQPLKGNMQDGRGGQ